MGKYDALSEYLCSLPVEQVEVRLSLPEIEEILGEPLPPSASYNKGVWANAHRHSKAQSWLSVGWRVIECDLDGGTIAFSRSGKPVTQPPRRKDATVHSPQLKWDRLLAHLNTSASSASKMTLQLDEIEEIVGGRIPQNCRRQQWWLPPAKSQPPFWNGSGWMPVCHSLDQGLIEFLRVGEELSKVYPEPPRSPNENMADFFAAIPDGQTQVVLTFEETEAVRGTQLPSAARDGRNWWSNSSSSRHAHAWLQAGWNCDIAFQRTEIVVFRRKNSNLVQQISRYVHNLLDGYRTVDRPPSETLAKWLNICRLIEWYFEGTVVYERSGPWLDSLDEVSLATIEEDYQVCKRELTRHEFNNGASENRS